MERSRSLLGQRAPLAWALLPFAAGLIAGKLSPLPVPVLPALVLSVLLLSTAAAALSAPRAQAWAALLGLGLACAGAAYYEQRRGRAEAWTDWPMREAELDVRIVRLFAGATAPDRCAGIGIVRGAPSHLRELTGQRLAFSVGLRPPELAPFRGMTVRLRGVLEPLPRRPPEDAFAAYLVDAGVNFRLGRGRTIEVVYPGSSYARGREAVRRRAVTALGRGLDEHPELAGALRGMLLGERQGLSAAQEDLFLRTGTMHLFAISGLHIGVIAGGLITLLRVARLPAGVHFVTSSLALWGYVGLTGAVPSAVRAWLMVTCLHAAYVFRSPGNLLSALAGSALLVLLLDPMQLFGAGFQMSYGIVAALLLYGVPMAERWTTVWRPWVLVPPSLLSARQRWTLIACRWLQNALAIGLAASLVGTLSGVAFFGVLTPAAILANLPLIPLAGLAILAGFASLLSGLAGLLAGSTLFNHAGALVLIVMQQVLELVAALPGAAAPARFRAPWMGEAALVLLLAAMVAGYTAGWDRRGGGFWLPVAVTLLILALGVRIG